MKRSGFAEEQIAGILKEREAAQQRRMFAASMGSARGRSTGGRPSQTPAVKTLQSLNGRQMRPSSIALPPFTDDRLRPGSWRHGHPATGPFSSACQMNLAGGLHWFNAHPVLRG